MAKNDTILNINLPSQQKEAFIKMSENMGTNPSNLLRMFIANSLNSKQISFCTYKQTSSEVENIDIRSWDRDIQEEIAILDTQAKEVFANLKKEGKL